MSNYGSVICHSAIHETPILSLAFSLQSAIRTMHCTPIQVGNTFQTFLSDLRISKTISNTSTQHTSGQRCWTRFSI